MTNEEMLNRIAEIETAINTSHRELHILKEILKAEPQENLEPKFDVPEIGQRYWCIYGSGDVEVNYWVDDNIDNKRLKQGKVFLKEQDCQKQSIYNLLRAKYVAYVKEYNDGWVADWSDGKQRKWSFYFNYPNNRIVLTASFANTYTDLAFVFKDKDFLPFIQKRMTDAEIRAVINHDLSCIEVGN